MSKANPKSFVWIEIIKALGLAWIFTNHIVEKIFGSPFIANPGVNWPSLSERIAQLQPLDGFGLWNISINAFRYFGWAGDQGVQLFLIASGFGLTWGLLNKQAEKPLKLGAFYLRRAERIYPLWWGVHILFTAIWLLTGWGLPLFRRATILSFLGIRLTSDMLYYFSPAWWYIGLIIQLYLVYPLLWSVLCKWGPAKLLLWSSLVAFLIRGAGLFYFKEYLDAWSRGIIFVTRLPEFVFGICLAAWMFSKSNLTKKWLRSPLTWVSLVVLYACGTFLSLTLSGMIFAPFFLGVACFILIYLVLEKIISLFPIRWFSPGTWIGEHSYSLFLVHHPIILVLIPFGSTVSLQTAGMVLTSVCLTFVLALLLESSVGYAKQFFNKAVKNFGMIRVAEIVGLAGIVCIFLLLGTELFVRAVDPQEVLGWGERPSLTPDPNFGWHLIPSQITHLRWKSYDYFVTSNSLGFPGPEYSTAKTPNTYRILVTGDAFSSAEGVDTDKAWPRLLETKLSLMLSDKKVEVLNFAITGYGPNQYEAVIRYFAPLYKPNLILLETFVNDFRDVLLNDQDVQKSIGFGQPKQDSLYAILRLEHLRSWLQVNREEPAMEIIRDIPRPQGYSLGNFNLFEKVHAEYEVTGKSLVAERLKQIKEIANETDATFLVLMVPASIQVCNSRQLAYYPKNVNINNAEFYDIELPQQMMREITHSLELPFYDLRKPLSLASKCPYQSRNMHWNSYGHQVIADYLVNVLMSNAYIP